MVRISRTCPDVQKKERGQQAMNETKGTRWHSIHRWAVRILEIGYGAVFLEHVLDSIVVGWVVRVPLASAGPRSLSPFDPYLVTVWTLSGS